MNTISRNDFCWCGSGKKYKKCHLEKDSKLNEYKEKGYLIPPVSIIKTPEQIAGIRLSGAIVRDTLDMVGERIKAGVTTDEINEWVHEFIVSRGAIPAPLNYNGFPKSTCTSINNVICHGIPDGTVLKNGDIINVDVTTILDGYFADASRMYIIGEAFENAVKLVKVAKECLEIGMKAVRPYGGLNEVGNAIEKYANDNGCSVVRELGGHGIGLKFHENPHVDHFAKSSKGMLLVPGMVFTIEPMINEGSRECFILDDDWTVVTKDNKLSAQWEHTIVVTEQGIEILTA